MKIKYAFLAVMVLILAISCKNERSGGNETTSVTSGKTSDAKQEVLSLIDDSSTKKKLKTFFDGGTEQELDVTGLTPEKLISAAKEYIGTPHCMGGISKKCIDCSGLLFAVFRDLDKPQTVHGSQEMARFGKIITDKTQLQKGDLVFFVNTYKPSDPNRVITHSGFYIENGDFIHTSSKKGVKTDNLESSYWKDKFVFATRLF